MFFDMTVDEYIKQNKNNATKPRLLLHICCAPCATSVIEFLKSDLDMTLFFYNPNILPKHEFDLRLSAVKQLVGLYDDVSLIVPPQDGSEFLDIANGMESCLEGGKRCEECFKLRLEKTAAYLAANCERFDCFATTLTVSPHKNAMLVNAAGDSAATKYDVVYLPSDFKKKDGYLRSLRLTKEYGLYRQSYCGCGYGL